VRGILNLVAVIAGGVMLADLVANPKGSSSLFNGIGSLWQMSINGLLGKSSTGTNPGGAGGNGNGGGGN
jgi:hypothetical protein